MDKHPEWWVNSQLNSLPSLDSSWDKLFETSVERCATGALSAVEIGCFPGGFIGELGRFGYRISGFDTHTEVERLNELFETDPSICVGDFYCESLDQHLERNITYSLVMSMGFIEHFDNWADIFYKHCKLCAPGGKIIIGAPNFATPLQRALHTSLDKSNIDNHCLHSMYPIAWKGFMLALGLTVEYCGSYGDFNFWTESVPETERHLLLINITKAVLPHAGQFSNTFNARESGYSLIVARRSGEINLQLDQRMISEYFVELSKKLSLIDERISRKYIDLLSTLLFDK